MIRMVTFTNRYSAVQNRGSSSPHRSSSSPAFHFIPSFLTFMISHMMHLTIEQIHPCCPRSTASYNTISNYEHLYLRTRLILFVTPWISKMTIRYVLLVTWPRQ